MNYLEWYNQVQDLSLNLIVDGALILIRWTNVNIVSLNLKFCLIYFYFGIFRFARGQIKKVGYDLKKGRMSLKLSTELNI